MILWFWLMYPPPRIEINMNAIENNWGQQVQFTNIPPPKTCFSNSPKWLRMTRNGQFCLICNFSNLFPLKWLRMTWNAQFHPICNFSNLFPQKWPRMTQNGQFHLIHNFSNFFPNEVAHNDLEWPISPSSQLFQSFPPKLLRMTRNGQFCMAKIKYTLIQGNFYERLPFYMVSCALRPTASLL